MAHSRKKVPPCVVLNCGLYSDVASLQMVVFGANKRHIEGARTTIFLRSRTQFLLVARQIVDIHLAS